MGPRARRRLAFLGAIVGLVVVGLVIRYVTQSGSHTPEQQQSVIGSETLGLIAGENQERVLHRLGRPTRKRAGCWIYPTNAGKFNGIYVGKYIDAVRFCFIGSVLSIIEDHWNLHDSKGPRWLAPVVISSSHPSPP